MYMFVSVSICLCACVCAPKMLEVIMSLIWTELKYFLISQGMMPLVLYFNC